MEVRLEQEEKALWPMFVTLSGTLTVARLLQCEKAKDPMVVRPSGSLMVRIVSRNEYHGEGLLDW